MQDGLAERWLGNAHQVRGAAEMEGLLLAHQEPGRVLSFVDIEGNLAPEDCFLSRQILAHPGDDDEHFLDNFIERTRRSPSCSDRWAANLRRNVRPDAVRGIFESMVSLSDHGDLMEKFLPSGHVGTHR